MTNHDELRQQLWELVYGLLSAEEVAALRTQIKSDPVAARLYAEVRLQADLVADAATVADSSLKLQPVKRSAAQQPAIAPRRQTKTGKQRSGSRGVNWLAGLAATALAVLLSVGLWWPQSPSGVQLAERFIVTNVEAPARLQAGVSQQVEVRTTNLDDAGRPAEVELRLVDAHGSHWFSKSIQTDEVGRGAVQLPALVSQDSVRLEVAAKGLVDRQVSLPTPVALQMPVSAEPTKSVYFFDKPAYEPGDTVLFGTARLGRFSKSTLPVTRGEITLETSDGTIGVEPKWSEASSDGVLAGEFVLPAGEGPLLGIVLSDADSTTLAKAASAARSLRLEPLAESALALAIDAAQPTGSASGAGSSGSLALKDDRDSERLRASDLQRMPETPSEFTDQLTDAEQALPQRNLAGKSDSAEALAFSLVDAPVRFDRAEESAPIVTAGKPIEVALPTQSSNQDWLVLARCAGQVVASQNWSRPPAENRESSAGRSDRFDINAAADSFQMTLDPAPEIDGEIEVSLYDNSEQPPKLLGEQLVFRKSRQSLTIDVVGLQDAYEPGERVKLSLQIVDEQQQPVAASLGVRVWNTRLLEATQTGPVSLVEQVLSGDDAVEPAAQDLFARRGLSGGMGGGGSILDRDRISGGAQGMGEDALAGRQQSSESARGQATFFVDHDFVASDLQASNLSEVRAAYDQAAALTRQEASDRSATLARVLMLGGLALLILLGMQALLKASAKAYVWLPALSVAGASLAVGFVSLNPQVGFGPTFILADRGATQSPASTPEATTPTEEKVAEEFGAPGNQPAASQSAQTDNSPSQLDESGEKELSDRYRFGGQGAAPAPDAGYKRESAAELEATGDARPAVKPLLAPADAPSLSEPVDSPAPTAPPPPASVPQTPAPDLPAAAAPAPAAPPATAAADEVAGALATRSGTANRSDARTESPRPANGPAAGGLEGAPPPAVAEGLEKSLERKSDQLEASKKSQLAPESREPSRSVGRSQRSAQRARGGAPDPKVAEVQRRMFEDRSEADLDAQSKDKALPADNLRPSMPKQALAATAIDTAAPAALYFNPALLTDAQGRTTIEFDLPNVPCRYLILIDAIGQNRIGSQQVTVAVE